MKNLDQWCNTNQPKRRKNKLVQHGDAILKLYENGYTIEQIRAFLASQKITASERYIYAYLGKNINKNERKVNNKVAQIITMQEPIGISKATQSFLKNLDKE